MKGFSKNLPIALQAARAGASVIRENFGKSTAVRTKGDSGSLVTDTDLKAESAILEILTSCSSFPILSEESGLSEAGSGPKWVVDPLDGTTNFARSIPFFATAVALINESEIPLGVIIDPLRQNEFYAEEGKGAYFNHEKLILLRQKVNNSPVLFVNHGHKASDRTLYDKVTGRFSSSFELRKMGSSALELCYVANGSAHGFICSGDEIWDYAAGALIAQEAGCLFTDWTGKPWDGKNNFVLIASPEIHGQLVGQLADLQ